MMRELLLFTAMLALAGCGAREGLKPAEGASLPPAPYGATATPTPEDLLRPPVQTRATSSAAVRWRSICDSSEYHAV